MKLEDQVVSLELSKQLKELGVKQESLWYWNIDLSYKTPRLVSTSRYQGEWMEFNITKHCVSAFTVAELGIRILPHIETSKCENGDFECYNQTELYPKHLERADTEANARAKMLIYLKGKNEKKKTGN